MPALQDRTAFADEYPHALLRPQVGTLFDAIFGAFGGAAEGTENRGVAAQIDSVITPISSRDHAAVQVQYLGEFDAVKADLI